MWHAGSLMAARGAFRGTSTVQEGGVDFDSGSGVRGWAIESTAMATRVRSYAKVNLGLAIGPVRADGFHSLVTMYQTLALHDVVTVSARRLGVGEAGRIGIKTNHLRVPVDGRNTAWKMVASAMERMGVAAEVEIEIDKRLPVQGGMGAGSANAAAALIGLERELGIAMPGEERLRIAAEVGSDVPLFLIGGAVLGLGRGEEVYAMPEFEEAGGVEMGPMACVVAVPSVGISTPAAFREWDTRTTAGASAILGPEDAEGGDGILHNSPIRDTLSKLSRKYASLQAPCGTAEGGTSDILCAPAAAAERSTPEKLQGKLDGVSQKRGSRSYGWRSDLPENSLLALVRTGIENDFEQVVFLQYPSLMEVKRQLSGDGSAEPAVYAALSGSGSALFGLYRSTEGARAAQQRVQAIDPGFAVEALLTETLPRKLYWRNMFAG